MINHFLAWLNAIYIKPAHVTTGATIDTEPKIETTKEINVSDITASAIQPSVTAAPSIEPAPIPVVPATLSPLDKAKAEFDKFVAFVEHGIEVLGAEAEADLVALKEKYR